jgi:hypothetical protein
LREPVDPEVYAAQMINCAELIAASTVDLPVPRPPTTCPDSTNLVSGHGSDSPALFHYPQSYAGSATTATVFAPNADDLIASLNRVMPG